MTDRRDDETITADGGANATCDACGHRGSYKDVAYHGCDGEYEIRHLNSRQLAIERTENATWTEQPAQGTDPGWVYTYDGGSIRVTKPEARFNLAPDADGVEVR